MHVPVDSSPVLEAEICTDGVDNDLDGFVDCDDSDCASDPTCDVILTDNEVCDNGMDNDYDGYTDCADSGCAVLKENLTHVPTALIMTVTVLLTVLIPVVLRINPAGKKV